MKPRPMILTKKQTTALDHLEDNYTSEVLFGGGAGGAKSVLGCYWQLKRRLKYPGTRGLIGREKLKTLKETTLNSFWEVCRMQGVTQDYYNYNANSGVIKFYNGSEILLKDLFLYPSDPNFDSLGSLEITDAFIDEANQVSVKARNIVKSRIRYRLEDYNIIPKCLYTCNPAKNWVYQDLYMPAKRKELVSYRKFIQALATDNPYISPHYIANLKTLDPSSQERLLFGNWEYDDDPRTLIDFESMQDMFTNEFVPSGQKYISADVARKGKDNTVIRVWDGWRIIDGTTLKGRITSPENVLSIKDYARKYNIPRSRIVVDEDGVGGGVVDALKCKGFINNSKRIKVKGKTKNYRNLKAQCADGFARMVTDRMVYDPFTTGREQELLIQELEQLKKKEVDVDKPFELLPKNDVKDLIGRSPDYSDCYLMRYYFELNSFKRVV